MQIFLCRLLSIFCVAGLVPLAAYSKPLQTDSDNPAVTDSVELETILGRHLLVGFSGTRFDTKLKKMIHEVRPGGIVIFARNIKSVEQLRLLTRQMQAESIRANGRRLLVAIDQEGGNVVRIKHNPSLPSALAISKTGSKDIALLAGQATGRLLKAVGINVNFAPVLDVTQPDRDRFLGTRVFGQNPSEVAAMGVAFAKGLAQSGVLPIAKHFPGHGSVGQDTHIGVASSPRTIEELNERDLVPFRAIAKELKYPWGAMLAHISFPEVDPSGVPATFSKKIVGDLLRKQLNPDALVITDDIEMAGAAAVSDGGERAVRALQAGADLVMVAWNPGLQRKALAALVNAYRANLLDKDQILASQRRIRFHEGMAPDERQSRGPASKTLSSLQSEDFQSISDAVLSAIRSRPQLDRSEIHRIGTSNPIFVLSTRDSTYRKFKSRAQQVSQSLPTIKGLLLTSTQLERSVARLRQNPDASVIAFAGGELSARLIDRLPEDIAMRTTVVHVETRALLDNPDRYYSHIDAHYRHPNLSAAIADRFFSEPASLAKTEAPDSLNARVPTSQGPPPGPEARFH